jgi:hypothetical protein
MRNRCAVIGAFRGTGLFEPAQDFRQFIHDLLALALLEPWVEFPREISLGHGVQRDRFDL